MKTHVKLCNQKLKDVILFCHLFFQDEEGVYHFVGPTFPNDCVATYEPHLSLVHVVVVVVLATVLLCIGMKNNYRM